MLKVFLVEDETVIREGLRDRIPWEQYGYRFVGEAADGEVALPLIRKTRPDVLITDIKMPFMDGLSLSRIVREEFPKTKILIISGYDDFEYAREAISIGVDQYILKPVTRMSLRKVLQELKEKIITFIALNAPVKTAPIAQHIGLSKEEAFDILHSMSQVDHSIHCAGQCDKSRIDSILWLRS